MTKLELLEKLKSEISPDEAMLLRATQDTGKCAGLSISVYNRQTMIEMLEDNLPWVGQVDESRVEALRIVTNDYLAVYLADKPEAWKWIFLTCAYNSFIREIPMHPQEMVKYTTIVRGDKTLYLCPSKSLEPNTNCEFCVCVKLLGEGSETFEIEM